MISRDTIDKIYQAVIIEEVIGDFVVLKKAGKDYRGLSPFTSEKTPSFYVVPAKGIYKDFSSGKGGNVVDFLMQHQKFTYPEALRFLAQKYHIPIEEEQSSEEAIKEKSEREHLTTVTEFANRWFQEQLHTELGEAVGLSYFLERGFREATLATFQLGFAPAGWDNLKLAAEAGKFNLDYLVKAGLLKEKVVEKADQSTETRRYDAFRDRVMFPIHSESGKVIAFAGRTLQADLKGAKYINSPESELFHKSHVLYGLHLAKNKIAQEDLCYLVEGYTDVISLYQSGVENVVASCGTSLTEGHIKKMIRYTKNVTVLYDGDAAGVRASIRSIEMILKQGMNVRVVLFPDGDDPDSFAKKHNSDYIQNYLHENAQDFIRFKTNILLQDAGNDPIKRADLVRDIVNTISVIPDTIKRDVYIQECSRLLGIAEETLVYELNKILRAQFKKANQLGAELPELPAPTPSSPEVESMESTLPSTFIQEREILRLLLNYGDRPVTISIPKPKVEQPDEAASQDQKLELLITNKNIQKNKEEEVDLHEVSMAEFLVENLTVEGLFIEDESLRNLYREYVEILQQEEYPQIAHFINNSDTSLSRSATDLITSQYALSPTWVSKNVYITTEEDNLTKAALDSIYRLRLTKINRRCLEITNALESLDDESEESMLLLHESALLNNEKVKLARYFGTVLM